jgi:hypothetical protein
MIGRVEQRVDIGDGHPLGGLSHLHDVVATTHLARLQDAEVEARPSAGREQCRHARLVHPNAEAIAGDARLRYLEQGAADPISIADAHFIIGQSFNGEVLAELPVDEVGPFQLLLPIAVRFDLVDIDRALFPAVSGQVALTIAVDIQSANATAARHGMLPDRGVHRATLPRDVARKSDVYREQSTHVARVSVCFSGFLTADCFSDREIAVWAVRNHCLTWFEMDLRAIDLHGDDIRLE